MASTRGWPVARQGPDFFSAHAPVTPAIVYLAVGLLVGPAEFNLFHFNPLKQSARL
jgi:hypothetical protein